MQVSFSSATYTADEGSTAQVTVQLDTIPKRTLVIPLTVSLQGGATTEDVGTLPTSVTFTPIDTAKLVTFTVIDEYQNDPGESITLAIGQNLPDGVTTGTTSQTTVDITDSGLPTVSARFVLQSYTAAEGTTARIDVHLDNGPPGRSVTIPLTSSFQGGATTADVGSLPSSITFGPTEALKTIAIPIIDDKQSDPGESITLAIGQSLPGGVRLGVTPQITIDITDTGITPVTIRFTTSSVTASEGTLALMTLALDKAPGRTLTFSLTYAFLGDTTESDLETLGYISTTINFDANDTSITVGVLIEDDGLADPGESFTVTIGEDLPEGVTAGTPDQVTVNITDTGVPTVEVNPVGGL